MCFLHERGGEKKRHLYYYKLSSIHAVMTAQPVLLFYILLCGCTEIMKESCSNGKRGEADQDKNEHEQERSSQN